MQRIYSTFTIAAILLAITGCGTMLNMDGKEKVDWVAASVPTPDGKPNVPKYRRPTFPFGGLANDVAWIKDSKEPTEVILSLVDMPFSLVGDIVTFPWTLGHHQAITRDDPKNDILGGTRADDPR